MAPRTRKPVWNAETSCEMRGCLITPQEWPGYGRFCGKHSRVMIPRSKWEAMGVTGERETPDEKSATKSPAKVRRYAA